MHAQQPRQDAAQLFHRIVHATHYGDQCLFRSVHQHCSLSENAPLPRPCRHWLLTLARIREEIAEGDLSKLVAMPQMVEEEVDLVVEEIYDVADVWLKTDVADPRSAEVLDRGAHRVVRTFVSMLLHFGLAIDLRAVAQQKEGSDTLRFYQHSLFWFEYFGTLVAVDYLTFASAVCTEVALETGIKHPVDCVYEVLCRVVDRNSDREISFRESDDFLRRFGPIRYVVERARDMCIPPQDPHTKQRGKSSVRLSSWYAAGGRSQVESLLRANAKAWELERTVDSDDEEAADELYQLVKSKAVRSPSCVLRPGSRSPMVISMLVPSGSSSLTMRHVQVFLDERTGKYWIQGDKDNQHDLLSDVIVATLKAQRKCARQPNARAVIDGQIDGILAARHDWQHFDTVCSCGSHSPLQDPNEYWNEIGEQLLLRHLRSVGFEATRYVANEAHLLTYQRHMADDQPLLRQVSAAGPTAIDSSGDEASESASESGASVTPDEASDSGASVTPDEASDSGASVTPDEASDSGASVTPDEASDSGASVTSDDAPDTNPPPVLVNSVPPHSSTAPLPTRSLPRHSLSERVVVDADSLTTQLLRVDDWDEHELRDKLRAALHEVASLRRSLARTQQELRRAQLERRRSVGARLTQQRARTPMPSHNPTFNHHRAASTPYKKSRPTLSSVVERLLRGRSGT